MKLALLQVFADAQGVFAADRSQLDSMDSTVLPLTPALLPYGVKKAMTAAASAGDVIIGAHYIR